MAMYRSVEIVFCGVTVTELDDDVRKDKSLRSQRPLLGDAQFPAALHKLSNGFTPECNGHGDESYSEDHAYKSIALRHDIVALGHGPHLQSNNKRDEVAGEKHD